MKVAETFLSYQGEGVTCGKRTFFIRLAGCNLKCSWCDTEYARDKTRGEEMTWQDLNSKLQDAMYDDTDLIDICLTGGEPLLQQDDKDLLKFMDTNRMRHSINVETNGTIAPSLTFASYISTLTISPKLQAMGAERPLDYELLKEIDYSVLRGDVVYKFVVNSINEDVFYRCIAEINDFVQKNDIPYSDIWLMPIGTNLVEVIDGTIYIANRLKVDCIPYNVTTRQHILFSYK